MALSPSLSMALKLARTRASEELDYQVRQDLSAAAGRTEPAQTSWIDSAGNQQTGVAQAPMRAIKRLEVGNTAPGADPARKINSEMPDPGTLPTPERVTGAPVDTTLGELRRMSAEDRQRAISRILAVDGAKERIRNAGAPTLMAALARELAYQRGILSRARRLRRDAKTERHSKSGPKAEAKRGYRKLKPGGTASLRPNVREVYVPLSPIDSIAYRRKLRRSTPVIGEDGYTGV